MTRHLTVRLAWHDHKWDGSICRKPAENTYCVGSHSLLSDRLARDKQVAPEVDNSGAALDVLMPEYLPPCYWSSAAFAAQPTNVVHAHPFQNYRDTHRLYQTLPPWSVFTWPFRLSLTHGKDAKKKNGQYPADLDDRVDQYLSAVSPGRSLVFFYLNYDNPVSADDYKYAVVGCARLEEVERSGEYHFEPEELAKIRSGKKGNMRNFPTRNWAARITYDFPKSGIRLPYHEYLEHIDRTPDDESKLDEIKVLVEEATLRDGFKYVSEQMNDDCCLYLLYKFHAAFSRVNQHGIAACQQELERVEEYIEEVWKQRGLYPGLGSILGILAELGKGDPNWEGASDAGLAAVLRENLGDEGLLNAVFALLDDRSKPPYLNGKQQRLLGQARKGLSQYSNLRTLLRRLSLFNLTVRQLSRVLYPAAAVQRGEPHPFAGRDLSHDELAANPYILCEEYRPATENEKEATLDLDRDVRTDGIIDYFTIDVGLFPDERRYDAWDDDLQDLAPAGPERLRAFSVALLKRMQDNGHAYCSLQDLVVHATQHPLFYRSQFAVGAEQILAPATIAHFQRRLHVYAEDGKHFFYLKETKQAEEHVGRFVENRLQLKDRSSDLNWVQAHLDAEAQELSDLIPSFDAASFHAERSRLIEGVLTRPFFIVTGRPGSGKTRALREIMRRLIEEGQKVTVLAPTGKATLRVRQEAPAEAEVVTMDRWISKAGLRIFLDDLSRLAEMPTSAHYEPVENLIIDEASMVDLAKLAVIFRALEVHEPHVRRVVLVGDENQLPPIGIGRPLYDVLSHLHDDDKRAERHLVRLRTNCRQRQDPLVIEAAHLFAGKNRYHTDLYQQLLNGTVQSKFLRVLYWDNSAQLNELISERLDALLALSADSTPDKREVALNTKFGLYETGYVRDMREPQNKLLVDAWQLIAPYRGGFGGTLMLNGMVRQRYRSMSYPTSKYDPAWQPSGFGHSDKIIRVTNFYQRNAATKKRELKLSNGSIGILCSHRQGRRAYFSETGGPIQWSFMDEEDFEAAYAITVHKAQGSEFSDVFVIVPERRALLSRELVYTAMTRSTGPLTLFVQRSRNQNPLELARQRSDLLRRNSSVLSHPLDSQRAYEPEKGVFVKSKIEYLIHEALRQQREAGKLLFQYEKPPLTLQLDGKPTEIHPDFTVNVGSRTFYWEHLGMLDRHDYFSDWQKRRAAYEAAGLVDSLVTTDDLQGIRYDRIQKTIADILNDTLELTPESDFSKHHYTF